MSTNNSGDLDQHRQRFKDPINVAPASAPPNNPNNPPANDNKKYYKACGCGCLVLIIAFIGLMIWGSYFIEDEESKDLRITYLKQDMDRLTSATEEESFIASLVKKCVDEGVDSDGEVNKNAIKYFTRLNGEKLLVLLEVKDLKGIEPSSRKVIVEVIEECLEYMSDQLNINKYYICVEGRWNTLLVKTPNGSDLGGKYADDKLLLPFYNEYVKDSLPRLE